MKRRVLGLALCLCLALTMLPFGAFAANKGAYTLDLTSGTATPAVANGKNVVQTLNAAVDMGLCTSKIDKKDTTKIEARYDLDKDGAYDLGVAISMKNPSLISKIVFKVLDTTSVYGEKTASVSYSGSGDYYSPLTLKFPLKVSSISAKITFNANGGTGTMPAVTVLKNKEYTLPDCTFTPPEGKVFDKWDLGKAGDTVTITKDTVVTAQWKDKDTTPKNIENVEITFVNTDLKAGQKPTFGAKLSEESAKVATIKEEHWIDETDNFLLSSAGGDKTIIEGHTYSYGIELEPKEGYVFVSYTGLEYDGISYATSAIGHTLKAGGSGLELWGFVKDVEVIGEFLEKLPVDLTNGGISVPEPRCTVLHNTLVGANAMGQVKYAGGTVDLDKDGTVDLAFDKSTGVAKLQPTMSLTKDFTLTLDDEGINYVTGKGFTPYAKSVEFKLAPEAKTCVLDLFDGKATLTGDDGEALINTLQADQNGGLITLTKEGGSYLADLDKDGKNDVKVTPDGGNVEVEALETSSIADEIVLDSPLYNIIALAGGHNPYLTQLTVRFKAPEPAKDVGELTIDLSKDASVTLTQPKFAAFRASAGGLNFTHTIKAVTDGDVIKYDLDNDGKYDVKAEKKADGSGIFTVLETNSVAGEKKLTVGDTELAVINTSGQKEYYKTVTFKLPGGALVNPFVDVKESDIFYDAVLWAYYASPQVTKGISDTHFGPNSTVTRGQTVAFLWRAMGEPEPTSTTNPFKDVKESDYYYKAVLWAVEKNITVGVTPTQFVPNQTCSTAHIITFLYRTLGIGDNGWYDVAGAWATGAGLLKDLDLKVDPKTPCPRADVVLFLYRALK